VITVLAASWHGAGYLSNSILSGDIDRCYQKYSDKVLNAKDSVLGYFKSGYQQVMS
jgi:hypothetical protein